jgi:hypothetical protein
MSGVFFDPVRLPETSTAMQTEMSKDEMEKFKWEVGKNGCMGHSALTSKWSYQDRVKDCQCAVEPTNYLCPRVKMVLSISCDP